MVRNGSLERKEPKILLFDIETAPNLGYVWGKWEQNVIDFSDHWYLLSFSVKWLNKKGVKAHGLADYKLFKHDKKNDLLLTKELWRYMDEADILIAHNGDQFDVKKANALFVKHGMKPPSAYKTIDTKKVAKRYFRFDSNKLDDLGSYLGIGRKISTDKELWFKCMEGDPKAWKKMLAYNKQDVLLLEEVYLKLRAWMDNHPNLNVLLGLNGNCPLCGSPHLQKRGFGMTRTGRVQRYQCQSPTCGGWSSGKVESIKELVK